MLKIHVNVDVGGVDGLRKPSICFCVLRERAVSLPLIFFHLSGYISCILSVTGALCFLYCDCSWSFYNEYTHCRLDSRAKE